MIDGSRAVRSPQSARSGTLPFRLNRGSACLSLGRRSPTRCAPTRQASDSRLRRRHPLPPEPFSYERSTEAHLVPRLPPDERRWQSQSSSIEPTIARSVKGHERAKTAPSIVRSPESRFFSSWIVPNIDLTLLIAPRPHQDTDWSIRGTAVITRVRWPSFVQPFGNSPIGCCGDSRCSRSISPMRRQADST